MTGKGSLGRAADAADVEKPVTFTNFRKSSASYLASQGVSQAHLEDHHGWSRGSDFAARYISVFADANIREIARAHGIDVEHLHLEESDPYVFVPASIQKGGDTYARDTPISLRPSLGTARVLRHYLRDRWKDVDALCPSRFSVRMTAEAFRNVVSKLAREAGVEPYRTSDNV